MRYLQQYASADGRALRGAARQLSDYADFGDIGAAALWAAHRSGGKNQPVRFALFKDFSLETVSATAALKLLQ
jgi:hypothetical protein